MGLHHRVENIAVEEKNITEKEHASPLSTSKELVYTGDLGSDSFINHLVWTAEVKKKLHMLADQEPFSDQGAKIKDSITQG